MSMMVAGRASNCEEKHIYLIFAGLPVKPVASFSTANQKGRR